MRKSYVMIGSIVGLIVANVFIGAAFLTALCLILILLYAEMRAHEVKDVVVEKDKAMGNRVIEGMKALTDLCRNAFDHLKTHKQQIDKINAKLGDHTGRLHQLDQRQHRVVRERDKEPRHQEQPQETPRTDRTKFSPKTNVGRTDRKTERAPKNVPNAEPKS